MPQQAQAGHAGTRVSEEAGGEAAPPASGPTDIPRPRAEAFLTLHSSSVSALLVTSVTPSGPVPAVRWCESNLSLHAQGHPEASATSAHPQACTHHGEAPGGCGSVAMATVARTDNYFQNRRR